MGCFNESGNKPYFSYWGKTSSSSAGSSSYHLLPYHCLDVAGVVSVLMNGSHQYSSYWATYTGLSEPQIRFLCVFSFMLHDIGKFSERFQSLVPALFAVLFPTKKPKQYTKRHDTLGSLLWKQYGRSEMQNKNKKAAAFLELIIRAAFGHHGMPPEEIDKTGFSCLSGADSYFCKDDSTAALLFLNDCLEILPVPDFPESTKEYRQKLRDVSWTIAGIGTIADWIASDESAFPYEKTSMPLSQYWNQYALPRAEKAVARTGWNVCPVRQFKNIQTIFPFIQEPTPLQKQAASLPMLFGPQLFIVEDVTGAGKTEAAVLLASRIMSAGNADGLYVALPTMATANAMFSRLGWAYRSLYRADARPSLILSHGARHLSKEFEEMLGNYKESVPFAANTESDKSYSDGEKTASCSSWYADNKKKALLADVGVGTIDQALLAVLPVRHQSMRFAGLQRKILIVDEVHAYDPYMETLLKTLLYAHARNGGSAILLSATIPEHKRIELMKSYYAGATGKNADFTTVISNAFPLITQVNTDDIESYSVKTRETVARTVSVSFFHENNDVLDFITKSAASGKCICWIRNTVNDVRQSYCELIHAGIPENTITVFHSRYAMIDRSRIEENVLHLFGKKSGAEERKGRVLIASQVVEQSLDLDFDELISDIAPIDLLIQRAGRLHRHIRDRNGNVLHNTDAVDRRGQAVLHVYAPEFKSDADADWLENQFAGTLAVYRDAGKLWLTEKILTEKGKWHMPEDARELIESVYGEQACTIPGGLVSLSDKAAGKAHAEQGMGELNVLDIDDGYCRKMIGMDMWDEDERVPTRLTADNQDVVLAVPDGDRLMPYAVCDRYPWDLSTLSVSKAAWNKCGYELSAQYVAAADALKKEHPNLQFSEIVVVACDSEKANTDMQKISEVYDPRMGWGKTGEENE
ncbi:MAG: CRISPR-associated helicase Cas3' [Treponema sp.]|nr:CRISPR-associated helicase Cas3' [Treponema sp.]